jgi:hypothetical protein
MTEQILVRLSTAVGKQKTNILRCIPFLQSILRSFMVASVMRISINSQDDPGNNPTLRDQWVGASLAQGNNSGS